MKVLVCPLNWGLGHAARCVPIIRQLIDNGHEPIIVSDGYPLQLLQQEFPTLKFLVLPSYRIFYSKGNSQIIALIKNLPGIIKGIFDEHVWLNDILKSEDIDQVISDNRFGMWNKKIKSIYITHQLMVKMPRGLKFLEPLIWLIHRQFIYQYNECWIPDIKENGGLTGDLAHKYRLPKNAKFIGTLSRFQNTGHIKPSTEFEVVAVLSGVEPQRTIFENEIVEKLQQKETKSLIVQGLPQETKQERNIGNITIVSHLSTTELATVLVGSRKIISRSGYSTIMDLDCLNCLQKAEFIATPGQTEQEYLQKFNSKKI